MPGRSDFNTYARRGLPGAWPFQQCTGYGRRGSIALSSRGSTEGSLTPDARNLHPDGPSERSHTKISHDSREAVKACAVFSKPSDHEIINTNVLNSTKWHTLMFSVVTRGILVPSGLSGDLRGTQQAAFLYVSSAHVLFCYLARVLAPFAGTRCWPSDLIHALSSSSLARLHPSCSSACAVHVYILYKSRTTDQRAPPPRLLMSAHTASNRYSSTQVHFKTALTWTSQTYYAPQPLLWQSGESYAL